MFVTTALKRIRYVIVELVHIVFIYIIVIIRYYSTEVMSLRRVVSLYLVSTYLPLSLRDWCLLLGFTTVQM
jgi:hypothetical protein